MTKRLENPHYKMRGDEDRPYDMDGVRYFHITAAARMVGVPAHRMFEWASKGVAGRLGIKLDVYNHLGIRRLVPETDVLAMKELIKKKPTRRSRVAPHP